jgi:hypothetical protein
MHISSCDELKNEFMEKHSKEFDITGEGLMETFLGMEGDPSFKIMYQRGVEILDLLSGYTDPDLGNSSCERSTSSMLMRYTTSPIS